MRNNIGLKIFVIIIIGGLIAGLIITDSKSECGKCIIDFKNTKISGIDLKEPIVYSVNITELYEGYINNICQLSWTKTNGYYYHK